MLHIFFVHVYFYDIILKEIPCILNVTFKNVHITNQLKWKKKLQNVKSSQSPKHQWAMSHDTYNSQILWQDSTNNNQSRLLSILRDLFKKKKKKKNLWQNVNLFIWAKVTQEVFVLLATVILLSRQFFKSS